MKNARQWLIKTSERTKRISEAYQRRLKLLWWLNLLFLVLPAVLSAAAAIIAAVPGNSAQVFIFSISIPLVSLLAGTSAVLLAVHKALKCDEYQHECLHLSQAFQSLSMASDAALIGTKNEIDVNRKRLANELESLIKNAKARISESFMGEE